MPTPDIETLAVEYQAGASMREVAAMLQTSRREVARVLRVHQVPVSPRRPRPDAVQLADEYRAGATIAELAETHRLTRHTISRRLREHGVELRTRTRRATLGTPTAVLVAEYVAGASTAELGRKYGPTRSAVGKRIRSAGVQMRVPNLKPVSTDQLAADYATGLSIARVAAKHGLSEATVRERFKKANIPTRSHAP